MTSGDFTTVEGIFQYTKPKVDAFRQFPSTKNEIVKDLRVIFEVSAIPLAVVIKDGKFVESFTKKMGKGRMKALKKLLYSINIEYYQQIDFKDE